MHQWLRQLIVPVLVATLCLIAAPGHGYDSKFDTALDTAHLGIKRVIAAVGAACNDRLASPPSANQLKNLRALEDAMAELHLGAVGGKHPHPRPNTRAAEGFCYLIDRQKPKYDQEIRRLERENDLHADRVRLARLTHKKLAKFLNSDYRGQLGNAVLKIAEVIAKAVVTGGASTLRDIATQGMHEAVKALPPAFKIPPDYLTPHQKDQVPKRLEAWMLSKPLGYSVKKLREIQRKHTAGEKLAWNERNMMVAIMHHTYVIITEMAANEVSNGRLQIKINRDAIKDYKKKKQAGDNYTKWMDYCRRIQHLPHWTTVILKPLASLSKTATPNPVSSGGTVTYRFTFANTGHIDINRASVRDSRCAPKLVGGDSDGDGNLDERETWVLECSEILKAPGGKQVTVTNKASGRGIGSDGTRVSVPATVKVKVKPATATVPNVIGRSQPLAESTIRSAKLKVGTPVMEIDSPEKAGTVLSQKPVGGTKVAVGSMVSIEVAKDKVIKPERLFVDPPRATVTEGETTEAFQVWLVLSDGSSKLIPNTQIHWTPAPGPRFTFDEPGLYTVIARHRVDHRVTLEGSATVDVEEDWSDRGWEDPISHSDQLTAKALPPPPDAFTWYALCNKSSGDVVYGETTDPTKYDVLGGPFQGPRDTKMWINQNIPSWRCPSLAGKRGEWNVLCNKQSYSVGIGKSTDPTKFWIMASGFPGEPEARTWAGSNCPSWMCTEGGGCASGPRGGGDWAVVCSKNHGGIGLTRHPNSMTHWIFASGLLGEKDARLWVNTRCPSWRCNRDGQCMPGERVERDEPLELPPFDDLYARRQRLLDEKADEDAMDQAMQMEGDSRTGRPGFTSKGLNKDLDKTHVYVKAECKEDKDCQEGQECKDGKCVQKKEEPPPTEEIVRLEVDPPEATIPLDGEVTFKAFAILRDGKREPVKAEWNRPNPYKGEAGSDTITATYGEFSKSATITVSDKPTTEPDKPAAEPDKPTTEPDKKEVSLLTITKGKTLVMQDETVSLVATATFKDGKKIKDTATFRASGAIIKLGKKEISTESQEISWNLKHKGKKYDGNWLEVTAKYKDASGNVASDSAMVIVCPPHCHKKRDGSFACCCD